MEIVAYQSFGAIHLGETEEAVTQKLGQPARRILNKANEIELQFPAIVVRLHSSFGVVEITARPDQVKLNQEQISRHQLADTLRRLDAEAVDSCGFVVSRKFGVAVDTDSENDGWISLFSQGRWDFALPSRLR